MSDKSKVVRIKESVDDSVLENLGYYYSIMEGGFISKNRATIVIDAREPYVGQVMNYRRGTEDDHKLNISVLAENGLLEDSDE